MRHLLRALFAAVVLAAGVPLLAGATVLASLVFLPLPSVLPTPHTRTHTDPSVVYDDQGHVIAQFRGNSFDVAVPDNQIAPLVKQAVVASEDRYFYKEGAVSVRGTMRAVVNDLFGSGGLQGGSTLTQQYVKEAYTNGSRTLVRKVHEAVLASAVSRRLTKDQILYRYLSDSYFGEGAYGVGAAALTYFRTPVGKLDASQAATLAGVLPAPSAYDPLVNLTAAEDRRETVLGLMHQQGILSDAQYEDAMSQRLTPASAVKPGVPVTAVYPPDNGPPPVDPYFADYLRQWLLQRLSPDQLYGGGLTIDTTIDPADQAAAQNAENGMLTGTSAPVDGAVVSVEPSTGYVRAMVGGRDYSALQVNLALGGCPRQPKDQGQVAVAPSCWSQPTVTGGGAGAQPGSGFKVFTLAAALQKGVPLTQTFPGPPTLTIGKTTFHNNESEGGGVYDLKTATDQSINTYYVQLANQIGLPPVAQMAKQLGITSAWFDPTFEGLSLTLGDEPVAPLDMASAYGVFADQGNRVDPVPVVRVTDASGRVLIDNTHPSPSRVISPEIASQVTNILEGVIQPGGTAYPNAVINRPEAGKTGTTESCSNAWFTGYTPQLSTSVWMGHSTTVGPLTMDGGCEYGGLRPAKAWAQYMSTVLAGQPPISFAAPPPQPSTPEAIAQEQLGGFAPGNQQYPGQVSPGGPYVSGPPPLTVAPPTTAPTTTTTTSSTTTTTTTPLFGGGGGTGGGGGGPPTSGPPGGGAGAGP